MTAARGWQTLTVAGRWMDRSQPQTLQAAVMFSYLNAALALLTYLVFRDALSLALVLLGATAYGIANDRRWAYWAGVVLSCLYLASWVIFVVRGGGFSGVLNLIFAGVLVALLLHPQSREYQRIWFH